MLSHFLEMGGNFKVHDSAQSVPELNVANVTGCFFDGTRRLSQCISFWFLLSWPSLVHGPVATVSAIEIMFSELPQQM